MIQNITETIASIFASIIQAASATGPVGWLLAIGAIIIAYKFRRTIQSHGAQLHEAELKLARTDARLEEFDALKDALDFEREKSANLETAQVEAATQLQERERAMQEMRTRFENDFSALASKMLNSAHETFLSRANETFQKHQAMTKTEDERRQQVLQDLVKPMREKLHEYQRGLQEMRAHQQEAQGALTGQIEVLAKSVGNVQAEAAKLSTALKSGPKTRGRWGEEQLRNIVELAGLSAYCDFSEQQTVKTEGQLKQPDMVVRLPGERIIAIDSKVSLSAYLDALDQTDPDARSVYFAKHANEIWNHVKLLSAKDYAGSLKKDNALDFVVMFIPGENFYAAAMEMRPTLFQDAFDKGILIATPTTLIAILKSVAFGWRQEKASDNARHVAELASDLYGSMRLMGANLQSLGKSLEGTVKAYNKTIGNIEGNVMPKARKFAEFEMPGTQEALSIVTEVEPAIREIKQNRDLIVDQAPDLLSIDVQPN